MCFASHGCCPQARVPIGIDLLLSIPHKIFLCKIRYFFIIYMHRVFFI